MSDSLKSFRRLAVLCGAAFAVLALAHPATAAALTHDQIVENCREAAKPQMQVCMQGKKGSGDRYSNLAACRAAVGMAIVRACVTREEQRLAVGKAAPEAPKEPAAAPSRDAAPVAAAFVPPPRTIADITAILDGEKPDAATIARRKADADMAPPSNKSAAELTQFYYDRGTARALLGRNREALADAQKALEASKGASKFQQTWRIHQFLALQYKALGDPKQGVAVLEAMIRDGGQTNRGSIINAARNLAQALVAMGDVNQAEAYARRVGTLVQEARGSPNPKWQAGYQIYGNSFEADADLARALVLEARGQYPEAEAAYRRSESFRRASLKDLSRYDFPPPPEQIYLAADGSRLALASTEAKQGRLSEAEADARRALLGVLDHQGKYSPDSPRFIIGLAGILVEQGRHKEAEKLARSALEVERTLGIADEAPTTVGILAQLGNILMLQRKDADAALVYAELDRAVAQWEPQRRAVFELNGSRIMALYAAGQLDAGIAAAQELVKRQIARGGDAAAARGTLAMGYARAGREADAIREFKAAIPVMMAAARENADDEDTTLVAARSQRLQRIVESYIGLLARDPAKSSEVAAETFGLADAVRGHSVQQALEASSARLTAADPLLAELVRTEQDLGKQINAELGTLNNALALPSGERDEQGIGALNAALAKLRSEREKARQDVNRRFPSYADLVDPKPPSVEQIKATLRPGEALLSFYFGQDASFVWAVPKDGTVAFAAVKLTALELEAKVRRLRAALEPEATTLAEIPPFDLPLAYELYAALLKPVEDGWRQEKSLIVVTNGALGLLPLSLLPTAPVEIKNEGPMFSGYRSVPWLARTHAVAMVPSAAALRTLRALPPGKATRDKLIGFGDPLFSKEQAQARAPIVLANAGTTVAPTATTRGLPLERRSSPRLEGVNSAELAMLPPLPDTAEELKAIAAALGADPAKSLNLGKDANVQRVKSLDLSSFKVVAFATHGLVPGELDGLTQPALALSAPEVSGTAGDGLLTMGEILTLKLDADWVVLSACNTAAGAGEGAEAASGLGRAFFYAGTRAILVTNWSVDSASARALVSEIFRRQTADPTLSR
ncbi:MAG TPA: CHAT domain-containing protein, partial [Xanthobacteraceae bacterium]|nr:CHAT domain-containing protein [Xanthobacteraceae bacterium]